MNDRLFEKLLRRPSIFKDETKLDLNYIPYKLPHRNKELSLLSQLFLSLITNPNIVSRKILITGKTGIGKTATVKLFGEMLVNAARKRKIMIDYTHINCRKERTSYKVLIKIISSLEPNFPKRGYSPQDILEAINDLLNKKNSHLLIVLDELSYLIKSDEDIIYSLTRLNDDSYNLPQRISIIGIVRDLTCLNNLDVNTLSTLQRNIIKFNDYSNEQIFDILKFRAELGLNENVISDHLLHIMGEIVFLKGDIRYGLNLMWRACKIAENKNMKTISIECIRLANQELLPFSTLDILKDMTSQKIIFLFSIVKHLKKNKKSKTSFMEILESYIIICENIGLKPRSYSQLWNYLQEFKRDNLIYISLKSKNIKGRKAFIEITDIPLLQYEKMLTDILNSRALKI